MPVLHATPWDVPSARLLDARADDEAVDIKGEAKVETKEGTTKGNGLPCVAAIFDWNPAPESKNEEAKLLRGAGTPPEAAGEAGGAETAALDGTGSADEAAKWDWTAAWTAWEMKAASSGEKGTAEPGESPLEVDTLGARAWLAEDDVLPGGVEIDAATDDGIPNKAASWLVFSYSIKALSYGRQRRTRT